MVAVIHGEDASDGHVLFGGRVMGSEGADWSLVAVAYAIGVLSGLWAGYCVYKIGSSK
jgi:hypothetical protein